MYVVNAMNYYILLLLFVAATQGSQTKRFKRLIRIDKSNDTDVPKGVHCFSYTWLANEDIEMFAPYLNKTCSEKYSKDKPHMRLCVDPMAVTDNYHEPDHELLYKKHPEALCKLQKGQTCVKYTYKFNGAVENITRYCAKVTVDDIPMESGCVVSNLGSGETEVCACSNMNGLPCNGSSQLSIIPAGLIILIINLLTLYKRFPIECQRNSQRGYEFRSDGGKRRK